MIFSLLAIASSSTVPANAQVSVHFNIGVQPIWGPTGYDYVDYYYLPDIDAYYSVSQHQYTYYDGGRWISDPYLPQRYRNFDLYGAHKVVINEPTPWLRNDRYHSEYAHYRGQHDQGAIRDSRDSRYYENPGHPRHSEWHGSPDAGRQQGNGHQPHQQGPSHGHDQQHGEQNRNQAHEQPQQHGGQEHGHGQEQHGRGQNPAHEQPQQHGGQEHGHGGAEGHNEEHGQGHGK